MTHKLTEKGIETTFVPERDLFRLIKYGTYDLLELTDLIDSTHGYHDEDENIEIIPHSILTDDEHDLIGQWLNEYAPNLTNEEEFDA